MAVAFPSRVLVAGLLAAALLASGGCSSLKFWDKDNEEKEKDFNNSNANGNSNTNSNSLNNTNLLW